jgi:hypothetical protein
MSARQLLQILDRYHPTYPDVRRDAHDRAMLATVRQATDPLLPQERRDQALARLAEEWDRLYATPAQVEIPAPPDPDSLFRGDVVRRASTGRLGVVLSTSCDVECGRVVLISCHVRVVEPADEEACLETWPSEDVRRLRRRDPFRRYLAMIAAESDPVRIARRLRHRRHARRYGPHLPEAAWDKVFWRLTHGQRRFPTGQDVWFDLGRAHWSRAANDCLERRRSASLFWMSRGTPESIPSEGAAP